MVKVRQCHIKDSGGKSVSQLLQKGDQLQGQGYYKCIITNHSTYIEIMKCLVFSAELRHLFSALCTDDAVVVRKAAAVAFPQFAESVEIQHFSRYEPCLSFGSMDSILLYYFRSLLPCLRFLTADPSDVVREKSVGACLAVARRLKDVVGPCTSPEEEQPCPMPPQQVVTRPKRMVKVQTIQDCLK